MKATTFTPTGTFATSLLTPDAVLITVGALVNRYLDRSDTPQLIIIDQTGTGQIQAFDLVTEGALCADILTAINAASPTNGYEPGAINPVPFEGI